MANPKLPKVFNTTIYVPFSKCNSIHPFNIKLAYKVASSQRRQKDKWGTKIDLDIAEENFQKAAMKLKTLSRTVEGRGKELKLVEYFCYLDN